MSKEKTGTRYLSVILKVFFPVWGYYVLQSLYSFTGLFFVGRFSSTASLVAVSTASQLMYVIVVMISAYSFGITRRLGAFLERGEKEEGERLLSSTVLIFASGSLFFAFLLYLLSPLIVSILSIPSEAVAETMEYLSVSFLSIPAVTAYILVSGLYGLTCQRGRILVHIAFSLVVNVLLDVLFVVKMEMGAEGVALATVFSQLLCAFTSMAAMALHKSPLRVRRAYMKADWNDVKAVYAGGNSEAAHNALFRFAMLFVTIIINRRGLYDAAAAAVSEKIVTIFLLFDLAFRSSVIRVCSGYMAEKNIRAARAAHEKALIIAALYGIISLAFIWFFRSSLVSLFTAESLIIEKGGEYLSGYMFEILFAGLHYIYSGYLVAYGMPHLSTLSSLAAIVFIRIPTVYIVSLVFRYSMFELGLASSVSSLFSAIVGTCTYFYFSRIKNREKWG